MPVAPLRPCRKPGCPALGQGSYCPAHQEQANEASIQRNRLKSKLYGPQWQRESKAFLMEHRYCSCGCGRKANVVDHYIAHKGDHTLFWDRRNWRSMAKVCHDSKTATTDGGFGNDCGF